MTSGYNWLVVLKLPRPEGVCQDGHDANVQRVLLQRARGGQSGQPQPCHAGPRAFSPGMQAQDIFTAREG